MLADGVNPVVNEVASDTVAQFGNKPAISADELKLRLASMGLSAKDMTKETVNNVLNQMVQELLLSRAADREGLKKDPEVIQMIKKVENGVLINAYLQKNVFKDVTINSDDEKDKNKRMELLAKEITDLTQKEALQINSEAIDKAFGFSEK